MSPVARGPELDVRRALIVGVLGVVAGVGLIVLVARLAGSGSVEVKLGDETFQAGDASRLADEIADRGPIIYSDVAGGSRDIILQHVGDDPQTGWLAFDARAPGRPRDCFLEWRPEDGRFVDACDESLVVGPEGDDLPSYPVTVDDDGDLSVDINAAVRD